MGSCVKCGNTKTKDLYLSAWSGEWQCDKAIPCQNRAAKQKQKEKTP